jgi:hypothetical protein
MNTSAPTPPPAQPELGVPYAMVDFETGERICPGCGTRIAEEHDRHGEEVTANYATHYTREHTAG